VNLEYKLYTYINKQYVRTSSYD